MSKIGKVHTIPGLKYWIEHHSAISVSALEKEAEMSQNSLHKYLSGTRGLPKRSVESLKEVIKRYGFKE